MRGSLREQLLGTKPCLFYLSGCICLDKWDKVSAIPLAEPARLFVDMIMLLRLLQLVYMFLVHPLLSC